MTGRNPLLRLREFGQSVWLDYIQRELIDGGGLERLIREDGLAGVTSNPAIFEKAIAAGREYEAPILELARRGLDSAAVAEAVTLEDVGRAADLFRPLHEETQGSDGFVSIEVSPHLARDTAGTIAEAQRLWSALGRPNVMIKVPATPEGLPAIRALIAAGVNVNVTLLFGVARYREAAMAHLAGLEDRAKAGGPVRSVASVASFFLSRIDTFVDQRLDRLGTQAAGALRGRAAVASARLAYHLFNEISAAPAWQALARQGARPQRLLWASTSTKDPAYSDVMYVEPLIGPRTVNTLPPATLDAYRDHGNPAARVENDFELARALPARLASHGVELEAVARELEEDGIRKFVESYDRLLATIDRRRNRL
ncbi:MAG: transaldolase [Burkholderiaceae bacterium]|jgi:transaldolase|nr:transaldolase [Burkholderiaceae bacterium]